MRDYLNSNEREKFLLMAKLMDAVDFFIELEPKGIITKEEKKNLKTSATLIEKTLQGIIGRLNASNKKTIANSINTLGVLLLNDYANKEYMRKKSASELDTYELNKDYFDLVEEIMYQNCKYCEKDCKECGYYPHFENNYLTDMGENYGNCRFAYGIEPRRLKDEEELKDLVKKLKK